MSKVNLQVNEKNLFGKYLPTVHIDRVTIQPNPVFTGASPRCDIVAEVSLYISVDAFEDISISADSIKNRLGALNLFLVKSTYYGFNQDLQKGTFQIQNLFQAGNQGLGYAYAEAGYSHGAGTVAPWWDNQFIARYDLTLPSSERMSQETVGSGTLNSMIIGPDVWTNHPHTVWPVFRITSLKDIMEEVMPADASGGGWSEHVSYDQDGNKIIKIGEYIQKFDHTGHGWRQENYLENLPKVFMIAFVGSLDVDPGDEDELIETVRDEKPEVFQRRFGNISYEHILNYNEVPNRYEEGYVYASSGIPFNGIPIQSIDGKYWDSTEASQMDLSEKILNLTGQYDQIVEGNPTLKANIDNVLYLLSVDGESVDLIPKLNKLRKTYSPKLITTQSGRFYNALKTTLFSYNRLAQAQDEVVKRFVLNTRVVDARRSDIGTSYLKPSPTAYASEDYIPVNWLQYSRRTRITRASQGSLGDFFEFLLEEGYADGSLSDVVTDQYQDIEWAKKVFLEKRDESEVWNYTESDALYGDTIVENRGYWFFDWEKAVRSKSQIAQLFNVTKLKRYLNLEIPYSYFPVEYAKMIRTENTFFTQDPEGEIIDDYETHHVHSNRITIEITSHMREDFAVSEYPPAAPSYVGSLWSGTDLGIYPYESYSPETLWGRPETEYTSHVINGIFSTSGADSGIEAYGYPYVWLMTASPDLTGQVIAGSVSLGGTELGYLQHALTTGPQGGRSYISVGVEPGDYDSGPDHSDVEGAYSGEFGYSDHPSGGLGGIDETSFTADQIEYFNAKAAEWPTRDEISQVEFSYVKFVNFDVMNPDSAQRLLSYTGQRAMDGYRLMCFEFRDFMDDDVAYYNTIGNVDHNSGEHYNSTYTMEVCVNDRTLLFYDIIYKKFKDEYDKFMEYYRYCFERCSYRSQDLRFAEWFTEACYEKWPDSSQQPWIRAPWFFNILRILLFRENTFEVYDEDLSADETLNLNTLLWIDKIGPSHGRLLHLNEFRFWFLNTLNMLYPQADLPQNQEMLDHEDYASMREIIAGVDMTRPPEERRIEGLPEGTTPVTWGWNPVYNALIDTAMSEASGEYTTAGGDWSTSAPEDHGTLYPWALDATKQHCFSTTFDISQAIYGEYYLSRMSMDDFQPPEYSEAAVPQVTGEYPAGVDDAFHAGDFPTLQPGEIYITHGSSTDFPNRFSKSQKVHLDARIHVSAGQPQPGDIHEIGHTPIKINIADWLDANGHYGSDSTAWKINTRSNGAPASSVSIKASNIGSQGMSDRWMNWKVEAGDGEAGVGEWKEKTNSQFIDNGGGFSDMTDYIARGGTPFDVLEGLISDPDSVG